MKANTRIPYASTLQLNAEENKDDTATGDAKIDPKNVKGEKQWQTWAGDFVAHQDHLTMKANTRIPYYSNVQIDAEENKDDAAAAKIDPKNVRGEKQWQ